MVCTDLRYSYILSSKADSLDRHYDTAPFTSEQEIAHFARRAQVSNAVIRLLLAA